MLLRYSAHWLIVRIMPPEGPVCYRAFFSASDRLPRPCALDQIVPAVQA
jgi:hypothetical protein